jgi:hypothetical protein
MRSHEDFMQRVELGKKSSLLEWYPIIKELNIPQIKTEIVKTGNKVLSDWIRQEKPIPDKVWNQLYQAMDGIGKYPMFMRTDQASGKHSWNETCFLPSKEDLKRHLSFLIEEHEMMSMAGELGYEAIVFREFIELEHYFTAFYHEFPVSKEVRCFIRDHKVISIHNYWFEDAIEKGGNPHDIYWREKLKKINTISEMDKAVILAQLDKVLPKFSDYWSVDFAKAKDGTWYLIDMARGEVSYHPENIVEKFI